MFGGVKLNVTMFLLSCINHNVAYTLELYWIISLSYSLPRSSWHQWCFADFRSIILSKVDGCRLLKSDLAEADVQHLERGCSCSSYRNHKARKWPLLCTIKISAAVWCMAMQNCVFKMWNRPKEVNYFAERNVFLVVQHIQLLSSQIFSTLARINFA